MGSYYSYVPHAERDSAIDTIMAHKIARIEFVDFFLGNLIGYGQHRYVFDCRMNPKLVVKIDLFSSSNANEFRVWEHVMYATGVNDWFAPCVQLSQCGRILTQMKCGLVKHYPEKIPRFFTDTKKSNFGMYKGRLVAMDYASHLLMEHSMRLVMKKARWWDEKAMTYG